MSEFVINPETTRKENVASKKRLEKKKEPPDRKGLVQTKDTAHHKTQTTFTRDEFD